MALVDFGTHIRHLGPLALALALPLAILAADDDGDGIENENDNCLVRANAPPLHCDTDQDGYGNFCDGDYDQDSAVGAPDFGLFTMYFSMSGAPGFVVQDHDCNGAVGASDFGVFHMQFLGMLPGPSGLACAGMPPCPVPPLTVVDR